VLDQFFKPEKSSTPEDGEEGVEGVEEEPVGLYRIDEKENGEGDEVVEEGGEYQAPVQTNPDYEDDEDDKPEEYGSWEDVFEQEV